jgi:hypothetical protein
LRVYESDTYVGDDYIGGDTTAEGRRINYGNDYANVTYYDEDMSVIHRDGFSTLFSDYIPYIEGN